MSPDHPNMAAVSGKETELQSQRPLNRNDRLSFEPKKLAIYTHDTFGMGHVRRCFNIIEALCADHKDWPILLISGSPALSKFDHRPSNVDILKLPTLATTGEAENQPAHLPMSAKEIVAIRKRVIKSALNAFAPDIFLVDNFPLGARKELLPSLKMLRDLGTRKVLGLRDIVEDPAKTKERWSKDGVYDVMANDYDHMLIYGHREIFDAGYAYNLPDETRQKLTYCGYVTRDPSVFLEPAEDRCDVETNSTHAPAKKHILVTVGGGGDGLPLLDCFFQAAEKLQSFSATVVAGPMMGAADWHKVEKQAVNFDNITLVKYLPDIVSHMRSADIVVCMGGYNTSAELLGLRRRAIIVPRDWRFGQHAIGVGAGEEKEQELRAEAMSRNGYGRVISPSNLTPQSLVEAIELESAPTTKSDKIVPLPADGAKTVAGFLSGLDVTRARA